VSIDRVSSFFFSGINTFCLFCSRSITQTWYETLTPTGDLTFVMSYCKNPFPEFKLAGLALLKAIVGHRWGQDAVLRTGGFIEYLLDRRVDNNKDATLDKYEVVTILSESPVFDAHQLLQLKR
jgi:26S proteasome non-ATPase regulatory subunit 5